MSVGLEQVVAAHSPASAAGVLALSMWRKSSAKNASLPTEPAPGGGSTRIWPNAVGSTSTGASASRVTRS